MKPGKKERKHQLLIELPTDVHAALVNAAKKDSRSTRAHAAFLIQQAVMAAKG